MGSGGIPQREALLRCVVQGSGGTTGREGTSLCGVGRGARWGMEGGDWRHPQGEGKDGVGRGVKSLLRGVLSEKTT